MITKTMNPTEQIKAAIIFLSERCDGAAKKDRQGFNGRDVIFGHSLADQILEKNDLSDRQFEAALKMLKTYKDTQLASNGYELPDTKDLQTELKERNTEKIARMFADKGIRPETDEAAKILAPKKILPSVSEIRSEAIPRPAKTVREIKPINQELIDFAKTWLKANIPQWSFRPFRHQLEAIKFIIGREATVLADTMGLGKTLSALLSAKVLQEYYKTKNENVYVIVLCPKSLIQNWHNEAAKIQLSIAVYTHQKPPIMPEDTKYIMIADECHAFQTYTSQRTKKYLTLATSKNCLNLINLSGTPIKNGRPANIYPILKACKHPIADDKKWFEKYFCDAKPTHFTPWDITGAIHLEELNKEISDILLRRTKEECLNLPKKIIQSVTVEATKELEEEYNNSLEELKKDYHERVATGEIKSNAEAIVFLGYFRRLASIYKTNQAITMAEELLEQGESVVIFTEFVESAKRIAEHFKIDFLCGETKERQKMVDDFQSGKNRVFVGTIRAGGVGITLTKASHNIIVDFPWTPGDLAQVEDRIHRIGQDRMCNIYNLYGKSIDYLMAGILSQKQSNIDIVLQKRGIDLKKKDDSNFFVDALEKLMNE